LDLAYLAEIRFRDSPEIRHELNELYRLSSKFYLVGISYLHWLRLDNNNFNSAKHKLDNLFRTAKIEMTPKVLLDTLINTFSPHSSSTLSLLEQLSCKYKNYEGALAAYLGKVKLDSVKWQDTETLLKNFMAAGYYDYANLLLTESVWKKSPPSVYKIGQTYFLKINFHLKNWEVIIGEYKSIKKWKRASWENQFYCAAAFTRHKHNNSDSAQLFRTISREVCDNLIKQAPSPWNYKAVFIQTQNLIADKQYSQARELLKREKTRDLRMEGTGSILFWSAVVSIFEKKFRSADSLLMLAASYTEEEFTQRALELRHWLITDSSYANRTLFFNGLEESPFTNNMKMTSLAKIPQTSPLWPYGQLETVRIYRQTGRIDSALIVLKRIQQGGYDQRIQLQAKALATFLKEERAAISKSLAIYDEILLKYQQGVVSEFLRERIRHLKSSNAVKDKL
jgi:hypothetical protein